MIMRISVIPLALTIVLATLDCHALKIPFKRSARISSIQRRSGSTPVSQAAAAGLAHNKVLAADTGLSINTVHDLIYLANVTIGGTDYPIQLDTGSSDLWIKGPVTPLPNTHPTLRTYNLSYGIGWAYGNISYANVTFADINVPTQAYLDVSSAQNPALSYGADGILGLGFTSLSTIDYLVNSSGTNTGRSLLYNLFADNPAEPNFIAFSLQRSADSSGSAVGSFAIGEYEPQYTNIVDQGPIPTFPVAYPTRWTVLMEALLLGNSTVNLTTIVDGAPSNRAVILLDSGTSFSYAPPAICTAIYGKIPGAQFDSNAQQWNVPCTAEVDMALQINGVAYPLHPLDVTPASVSNPNTCIGSFIPQSFAVGNNSFDWLIGDNFLRSVYSVYDFGDFDSSGHMGNPYVKLLSLVDPNAASKEFHALRGGTATGNITYNVAGGDAQAATGTTTVSVSDQVAAVLTQMGTYFPIVLGIMGFNALLLAAVVIVGIVWLCKRKSGTKRKGRSRMSPMPLNRISRFGSTSTEDPAHSYEPVSMANADEVFSSLPSKVGRYSTPSSPGDDQSSFVTAGSVREPSPGPGNFGSPISAKGGAPRSSVMAPPPSLMATPRPQSILNNPRPQSTLNAPRPQSILQNGARPQSILTNANTPRPNSSFVAHSRNTSLLSQVGPHSRTGSLVGPAHPPALPNLGPSNLNPSTPERAAPNPMEALLEGVPPSERSPTPQSSHSASHNQSSTPQHSTPQFSQAQSHHSPSPYPQTPHNDGWSQIPTIVTPPNLPSAPSPPARSPQRLAPHMQFPPSNMSASDRPHSMAVAGEDVFEPPLPAFRQDSTGRPRSMA